MAQVERVEKQGVMLLSGLRAIYVALGAFAGATLVTLLERRCFRAGSIVVSVAGGAGTGPGFCGCRRFDFRDAESFSCDAAFDD